MFLLQCFRTDSGDKPAARRSLQVGQLAQGLCNDRECSGCGEPTYESSRTRRGEEQRSIGFCGGISSHELALDVEEDHFLQLYESLDGRSYLPERQVRSDTFCDVEGLYEGVFGGRKEEIIIHTFRILAP